ncbi:MAG TPA: 50S ribosomal protein L15, partial [Candidatus Latescibacteria bacterium]|nr:50S ribosomal protein L15 [Candidatus Latescibacterota bacterium]
MKLGTISPPKGAVKKRKRLGSGVGSGQGKTSGKGHKGQRSRSGSKIKPWFEGGQM